MAKIYSISRESNGGKIGLPELINVYYTALMIFLVFTAGNDLAHGIPANFCKELFFYILLWISMVAQTTFAYKHIKEILPKNYNILAFLSDSIDICLFIYVCTAIGDTYIEATGSFQDLSNYRCVSIPFLILSVNQFCWYVVVQERNMKAVFRLILLFVVMLTATILDVKYHNIITLGIIVGGNFAIMVFLRWIDYVPKSFENKLNDWWKKLKKTATVIRLREKLEKLDKIESIEEMTISVEDKYDTK